MVLPSNNRLILLDFNESKAEINCKITITVIGIIECKIEVSGSFKDNENNSEITKKTTISNVEILPISLLPITRKIKIKKK